MAVVLEDILVCLWASFACTLPFSFLKASQDIFGLILGITELLFCEKCPSSEPRESNWNTSVMVVFVPSPNMFHIYVNDIPNIITSTAKVFADDSKIYRQINKVKDSIALQSDLTALDLWAYRWQVKFNPSKCVVMRRTHNKDKSTTWYQVSGTESRIVSSYKDLGVIMTNDLTWTKHVNETVHKANKVLGLLKHTVGSKKKDIFSIFYKSLVRPILEYASLVWSPHLAKDIHEIEKVQRRASRITLGQRKQEMAYEDRCKILKWNSL